MFGTGDAVMDGSYAGAFDGQRLFSDPYDFDGFVRTRLRIQQMRLAQDRGIPVREGHDASFERLACGAAGHLDHVALARRRDGRAFAIVVRAGIERGKTVAGPALGGVMDVAVRAEAEHLHFEARLRGQLPAGLVVEQGVAVIPDLLAVELDAEIPPAGLRVRGCGAGRGEERGDCEQVYELHEAPLRGPGKNAGVRSMYSR